MSVSDRRAWLRQVGFASLGAFALRAQYGCANSPLNFSSVFDDADGLLADHHVPGVSVARIDGGHVVAAVRGVRRAGGAEPVLPNTVFEAASMSKPAFAYAALTLVAEGALSLDTPLVAYLGHAYLPNDPAHVRITARMALTHTTGLPNWRSDDWQGESLLLFEPGTRCSYSGEGFLFLQRAVEAITGQSLDVFMKERLLEPLNMRASSYVWQPRYDRVAAAGHDEDGQPMAEREIYYEANAAYSLYTTPSDYARLLIDVMKPDAAAQIRLTEPLRKEMLTPAALTQTADSSFGFGWGIDPQTDPTRMYHGGSNSTGFRCYSRFCPAEGSGFVIMTNGSNGYEVRKVIATRLEELCFA